MAGSAAPPSPAMPAEAVVDCGTASSTRTSAALHKQSGAQQSDPACISCFHSAQPAQPAATVRCRWSRLACRAPPLPERSAATAAATGAVIGSVKLLQHPCDLLCQDDSVVDWQGRRVPCRTCEFGCRGALPWLWKEAQMESMLWICEYASLLTKAWHEPSGSPAQAQHAEDSDSGRILVWHTPPSSSKRLPIFQKHQQASNTALARHLHFQRTRPSHRVPRAFPTATARRARVHLTRSTSPGSEHGPPAACRAAAAAERPVADWATQQRRQQASPLRVRASPLRGGVGSGRVAAGNDAVLCAGASFPQRRSVGTPAAHAPGQCVGRALGRARGLHDLSTLTPVSRNGLQHFQYLTRSTWAHERWSLRMGPVPGLRHLRGTCTSVGERLRPAF